MWTHRANGDQATEKIATPTVVLEYKPLTPLEYADLYTKEYSVDPIVFKKVMWCESQYQPNPPGSNDGGAAFGIFQFHRGTFNDYAPRVSEGLDYYSYKDQIRVAAYMFSIGEADQWTCWHSVTGR